MILILKIIRRIKRKFRYTIPYPEKVERRMREASRARKRYIHIHFSIRKKQKPYYAKLKGIFYKVLRLRKKQSTPTTMKEKLKKHFLRKIGYWIITFFMIVEEVRVWTKRILKKIYKFFVTVRGVQHFFFIYFKYLRRHM